MKYIPGKANVDADALSRAAVSGIGADQEAVRMEQQKDEDLKMAREREPSKFKKRNGWWFREEDGLTRSCLPKSQIALVWKHLHDELGHGGPVRIIKLARKRFFWPKMRE